MLWHNKNEFKVFYDRNKSGTLTLTILKGYDHTLLFVDPD